MYRRSLVAIDGSDTSGLALRGFQRLMIGSIAEGLVRISTKPVLLIRGARKKKGTFTQRHGRSDKTTGAKRRDHARAMGAALYTGCDIRCDPPRVVFAE
jgi:hypothetical protein